MQESVIVKLISPPVEKTAAAQAEAGIEARRRSRRRRHPGLRRRDHDPKDPERLHHP